MLELRHLRYFTAIVDAGSLTRAAASLCIVQPALSQQIAGLESDLGVRLLNRSTRGVTPTEAGWALYKHAHAVLKLAGQTRDIARGAGERVSGRVRLGLPSTIAVMLVAPLVAALAESFPGVLLEVYESPSGHLAPQLIEERVDLSILVDDKIAIGVHAEPLLDERLYYVRAQVPASRSTAGAISLADVAARPMVLPSRSTTLRRLVDAAFHAAAIEPRVQVETSSIQTMLTLVAQSDLGTLVPYSALCWHTAMQSLHATPITPGITRKAWLARSSTVALTHASSCVRETLLQVVGRLVHEGRWQGTTLRHVDTAATSAQARHAG